MARYAILFSLLTLLAPAQQLTVKTATARLIRLEWRSPTATGVVERKTEGGTYRKLGSVNAAAFEDAGIDAYTTYRYRVLDGEGGKPSNEAIVGPPPAGIQAVAKLPQGDPGHYGANSVMALDENGDPVIAFVWIDPNGDADPADTEVDFVRWSRAAHAWTKPVRVVVTGEIPSQNVEPVSIACDPQTGLLAILTPVNARGLNIALSKDSGATWTSQNVNASLNGTVSSTAAAIAGGVLHVTLNGNDSGARYLTAKLDAGPLQWRSVGLPASANWKQPSNVNVDLVLDAAKKPLIAWYEAREEQDHRRVMVWRPNTGPIRAFDAPRQATDTPNLALASNTGHYALLVNTPRDPKDTDLGVWFTNSADGTAWSAPVKIPSDGPRTTNPPLAIALDSQGHALAVFGSNGGSAGLSCGAPAISRSANGIDWTTCGLGKSAGAEFGPQPNTVHTIFAGNDKAYVLWQEPGEQKYGQGILIWHER